jgi:hypothetical protein
LYSIFAGSMPSFEAISWAISMSKPQRLPAASL